jgi:hypothetical protein
MDFAKVTITLNFYEILKNVYKSTTMNMLISNVAWGKKKIHSCPSCMKLALKGSAVA